MTTTLQNTILNNLENKCDNIGNCIINLVSQGYIVNSAKWLKLKLTIILKEQTKYINSFDENTQHRIINLFNSLS